MRSSVSRSLAVAAVALLVSVTLGCKASPPQHEYTLQGQIMAVAPDHRQATIKHETIPGFMAAMTMPYKVRDAKELEGLVPGDLITSTLVVISNDAYLTGVRKVGSAPVERPAGSTLAAPASSGFELLNTGDPVPDTTFLDQDGKARSFASFQGSTVVLTFIYTKCPMPTFCPLMDRNFVGLQRTIKTDPALKGVHLVSVSFDPITDTPPVLKKHAATLGADPSRWTFLTGDRDDVDKFAARFGVAITREAARPHRHHPQPADGHRRHQRRTS